MAHHQRLTSSKTSWDGQKPLETQTRTVTYRIYNPHRPNKCKYWMALLVSLIGTLPPCELQAREVSILPTALHPQTQPPCPRMKGFLGGLPHNTLDDHKNLVYHKKKKEKKKARGFDCWMSCSLVYSECRILTQVPCFILPPLCWQTILSIAKTSSILGLCSAGF